MLGNCRYSYHHELGKFEKCDVEYKSAEAKLKEAKAEQARAKAELKEAQATGPTLEEVIDSLQEEERRKYFQVNRRELQDRKETLKTAVDYIWAVYKQASGVFCDNDSQKLKMCATGGTPGTGKTALLRAIALAAINELGIPAIVATFNGRGTLTSSFETKLNEGLELVDAFANALLESHFDIQNTKLPAKDVIKAIRVAA